MNGVIKIRITGSQRRFHLCNEQIFRERRKANDLLEQPLPLIRNKEVSANDQFKRVITCERRLISLLVAIALAKDQLFVDLQLIVPCPGTLSDVSLDEFPSAAIVGSVPGFCSAIAVRILILAVCFTHPDEPVRLLGMKRHERDIKVIWRKWSLEVLPKPCPTGGIHDLLPLGNKEGAVVRVRMHVIGGEILCVLILLPGVTFIAGLPILPVPELDEHGLETGRQFGVKSSDGNY